MDHKDLDVWKKSMKLVELIYDLSKDFPKSETYGLMSQIRRSAVSIPSNIAEGAARKSNKEFLQFISISLGSLAELETQYLLTQRLGITSKRPKIEELMISVKKLLLGTRNYLLKN